MVGSDSPRPVSPDMTTGYRATQAQAVALTADLEAVLGVMVDGVAVYDRTGGITYLNPALRTLSALEVRPGHERLPLFERAAIFHLRTVDGQPLADDQLPQARVLRGETLGGAYEAPEYVVTLLDGRTATIQFTGSPLRDGAGAITGAMLVFRDVTDQRRLERATQQLAAELQATFDAMADLALLYDDTGRLLRINRAMQDVLGITDPTDYTARTLAARGQPFAIRAPDGELLPPAEYPIARALRGELPTAAHPQELLITDAQGHERALSFTGNPVRDDATGALLGYITVGHDISERRRLEHERAEARASELTLREVNERLDAFVAMAAHDLRQPVTATKLRLEVAQRQVLQAAANVRGAAAAQQTLPFIQVAHALGMAQHDLDRLWRLMQQLLDVTQARQGTLVLDRQPCDLVAIVRAAVEEQRMLAPERIITLTLALPEGPQSSGVQANPIPDPPPVTVMVDADVDRLSQALTNYLANALRYSSNDHPIEVTVRIVEQAEEQTPEQAGERVARVARVEVSDHGLGIAPEEQATIWDRFQRARNGREAKGGLGLGLHIARTIVELHGGHVGVESAPGAGSMFWLTLPLGPTSA